MSIMLSMATWRYLSVDPLILKSSVNSSQVLACSSFRYFRYCLSLLSLAVIKVVSILGSA